MQLTRIDIKNFRCFSSLSLELDNPIILIQGGNGSGKTSILEAIHYLAHLKSFRTPHPKDMANFDKKSFFIKASFVTQGDSNELQT